jgi:hypothetical protein
MERNEKSPKFPIVEKTYNYNEPSSVVAGEPNSNSSTSTASSTHSAANDAIGCDSQDEPVGPLALHTLVANEGYA